MHTVTCVAPVNIAVIKYWGKTDETLILPLNDSISATLDTAQLRAKTTVMISPDFKEDKIWLNGKEEDVQNSRVQACLAEVRRRSQLSSQAKAWKLHICSENNFPTAAGLASSAAGYACLAAALAKLHKIEGDISSIARIGSGSACRSIMGGFVRWHKGTASNGGDSVAKQIVPASHWPDMRILILVADNQRKKVSSADGMRRSVRTSELLSYRINNTVPEWAEKMHCSIVERDFETFAELTMKDSNQMHAVCLDTYPPCIYMNDTSFAIIEIVHSYNAACGGTKVAYTFDAGPNATLYLQEKDLAQVSRVLDHFLPPPESNAVEYKQGIPIQDTPLSEDIVKKMDVQVRAPGQLKYMINTRVGEGPKLLEGLQDSLLNGEGWPSNLITSIA